MITQHTNITKTLTPVNTHTTITLPSGVQVVSHCMLTNTHNTKILTPHKHSHHKNTTLNTYTKKDYHNKNSHTNKTFTKHSQHKNTPITKKILTPQKHNTKHTPKKPTTTTTPLIPLKHSHHIITHTTKTLTTQKHTT